MTSAEDQTNRSARLGDAFRENAHRIVWISLIFGVGAIALLSTFFNGRNTWTDASGRSVGREIITDGVGSEHCSWRGLRYIVLGNPLGDPLTPNTTRFYFRDHRGVLSRNDVVQTEYASSKDVPAGAEATGYTKGSIELWTGADGLESAAYLVDRKTGRTERWPRLRPGLRCM